ncbi:polyphosphate kinase 2 [Microbaculum sp. FT89]|uniref:polyphosphate kinase 2 n=1 Tax=Microbaculum sp. FT89 TaxID=3447298 RepID=UPI003F53B39A
MAEKNRKDEIQAVTVDVGKQENREALHVLRVGPIKLQKHVIRLFNPSWNNRAGVEGGMGFCTDKAYEGFVETVPGCEHLIVRSEGELLNCYLDIRQGEQRSRLTGRRTDPLKQGKVIPIDSQALNRWDDYSFARNEMFARTQNPVTSWIVVRAENKRLARLNLVRDLLLRLRYDDKDESAVRINPDIVLQYREAYVQNGMIAP